VVCPFKEGRGLGDSGNSAKENVRDIRRVNSQNDESRSHFTLQNITRGNDGISLLYWILLAACMMKYGIFMRHYIREM
jgi:hypothetical protein